ncbi:MAG TPA: FIST N-terminal domain-containing protein [Kofleriaceae bacterium]|nr:FIST N-terminal domain-containing protein [Kofleriaceae bacterium]
MPGVVPPVRRAQVPARDPEQLARALADELRPRAGELVLVFVDSALDPDLVAPALARALAPAEVIGCTSSGEIAGPVTTGTAAALALGPPALRFGYELAASLSSGPLRAGRDAVARAIAQLGLDADRLDPRRHVVLTLHDGFATSAEAFCLGTAGTAPAIGFVGGVASHELGSPIRPAVFAGGKAHRDAGVVVVLDSELPFEVISSEHMAPTPLRTVVTAADATGRLIHELDGYPAAARWRELVASLGVEQPITSATAARFPFATYIGDRSYVRSIVDVGPVSLRVAAAVDEGSVLRIMQAGDLVASTRAALDGVRARLGPPAAVIAFSCVARHTEADDRGARRALDDLYASVPVVGFHSFGEQIGPLLVNHTLCALVLAAP